MTLPEIHKQFFALRNGMLADAVRSAGCPCPRIFGLNVPQLADIARPLAPDTSLAKALWAEKECRESRLLATYLFDPAETSLDKAETLVDEIQSVEEADMLAFRLLKRLPEAGELLRKLEAASATGDSLRSYTARILRRHLS